MRVVFDTNLLVSYLLTHRPPIATLIDEYLAAQRFTLISASVLLEELDRVLRYPRLQRYYDDETRVRFVALVAALSDLVDLPDDIPSISRDPDDDRVIACAVAGCADVIVSGYSDLLTLKHVGEIAVLTPAQFLARIEDEEGLGPP
ncbi:MAG: putative toxin-antitoxin system toxin component, PIN family [Anaerolineae bacterium]